jgi:hypothetical protein
VGNNLLSTYTNFLEKGEESVRKTIREYLYRYILEKDSNEPGSKDRTNKSRTVKVCIFFIIPKLFTS